MPRSICRKQSVIIVWAVGVFTRESIDRPGRREGEGTSTRIGERGDEGRRTRGEPVVRREMGQVAIFLFFLGGLFFGGLFFVRMWAFGLGFWAWAFFFLCLFLRLFLCLFLRLFLCLFSSFFFVSLLDSFFRKGKSAQ